MSQEDFVATLRMMCFASGPLPENWWPVPCESAAYYRAPKFFDELALAKADGSYNKLLNALKRKSLLVVDDFALSPLTEGERRDLLEVVEDRYGLRATIVASQLPVEHWHESIGEPTIADAILDRLVHNAHKIELKGKSMRDPKNETKQ